MKYKLNIETYIHKGSFFQEGNCNEIITFIKENSDDFFGNEQVIYYFYKMGYSINFNIDTMSNELLAEVIEILDITKLRKHNILYKYMFLTNHLFPSLEILSLYRSGNESVLFLKNNISFYYIDNLLVKIISPDKISERFITSNFERLK